MPASRRLGQRRCATAVAAAAMAPTTSATRMTRVILSYGAGRGDLEARRRARRWPSTVCIADPSTFLVFSRGPDGAGPLVLFGRLLLLRLGDDLWLRQHLTAYFERY